MEPHTMPHFKVSNGQFEADVTWNAHPKVIECIMAAALAAVPVFLEALMKCLSGTTPPGNGFNPGDRPRCQ